MQTREVRGVATKVKASPDYVSVTYHKTEVAAKLNRPDDVLVMLDSGGWRTQTTRTRMNQFSHEYCHGKFSVFQKDGDWFVRTSAGTVPFVDKMEFVL